MLRVDATEAVHPYDLGVAVAPELTSLSMENVLQIPVMDDTTATVGCAPLLPVLVQRRHAATASTALLSALYRLVLAARVSQRLR